MGFGSTIVFVLIAIVIHETWGHKLVTELVRGPKPTFVAIGIPITSKDGKWTTVFYTWNHPGKIPVVFSWLMIGGGVGFDDKEYYSVGKLWQKILMLVAGPGVNILISFLVLAAFSNIQLSSEMIYSYSMVTLEIFKSLFTNVTMSDALNTHGFFDLTWQFGMLNKLYWQPIAYFAFLNVSIGVLNLMPLPGLDGGQIVSTLLINIFGEKIIDPIKKINTVSSYILIVISALFWLWWVAIILYGSISQVF
jgi:regulator of sigma E protease